MERTISVFLRWVAWCVAAGFTYSVLVLVVVIVRGVRISAGSATRLIVYNTGQTMLVAAIALAMIFIPYGYVVWHKSQLRYFGESTPLTTGLVRGALVGALVGVVLGVTWRLT